MAAALASTRDAGRGSAIAGAAIALGGSALAVGTLILAIIDRGAPSPYTLAGLDVASSHIARSLGVCFGLVIMALTAGTIAWRRPRALLSVLFLALAASLLLQAAASQYAIHGLLVAPGSLPLADVAAWSQKFLPDLGLMAAAAFLLLFPTGRPVSPRWWALLGLATVQLASDLVIGLDDPYPLHLGPVASVWVPVTLPPALWSVGAPLSFASGAVAWSRQVLAVLFAIYLIRRLVLASGEARQQLKWFAFSGTILILSFVAQQADSLPALDWLPGGLRPALQQFSGTETAHAVASWSGLLTQLSGTALISIAIAIAIVRYRLYDIDIVINKAILYGGLALFVTGAYAIVVAGAGSLLGQSVGQNPFLTVVAIAVVAALLLPVRARLERLANAAIYGKRARPYDVLSDFAHSIGGAEPSEVLLPRMAQLLRDGTGASATEVWVKVGNSLQLAASSPAVDGAHPNLSDAGEVASRLGDRGIIEPVHQNGELLGVLALVKPRGEELSAVERRLFGDLASQAGLVLGRFRLVQELRESRSRLVAAQDLERRRIERDLHDGAQQRFVNALLALGMAESRDRAQDAGHEQLELATREVRAGLGELRSLARGLQPPLLAEAGLVPAVRALADRTPIQMTVSASTERRYPAGVESAAFFFVAEAVANAVKHSSAQLISVAITDGEGVLHVQVADDGVGGADAQSGTGLTGLYDRVAASGGRMSLSSPPGRGTSLIADLPCE